MHSHFVLFYFSKSVGLPQVRDIQTLNIRGLCYLDVVFGHALFSTAHHSLYGALFYLVYYLLLPIEFPSFDLRPFMTASGLPNLYSGAIISEQQSTFRSNAV